MSSSTREMPEISMTKYHKHGVLTEPTAKGRIHHGLHLSLIIMVTSSKKKKKEQLHHFYSRYYIASGINLRKCTVNPTNAFAIDYFNI